MSTDKYLMMCFNCACLDSKLFPLCHKCLTLLRAKEEEQTKRAARMERLLKRFTLAQSRNVSVAYQGNAWEAPLQEFCDNVGVKLFWCTGWRRAILEMVR